MPAGLFLQHSGAQKYRKHECHQSLQKHHVSKFLAPFFWTIRPPHDQKEKDSLRFLKKERMNSLFPIFCVWTSAFFRNQGSGLLLMENLQWVEAKKKVFLLLQFAIWLLWLMEFRRKISFHWKEQYMKCKKAIWIFYVRKRFIDFFLTVLSWFQQWQIYCQFRSMDKGFFVFSLFGVS